jgi:putative transposase
MNHTMLIERKQVLKAESHQPTTDGQGYVNGFKPKTLKTRVGRVDPRIPEAGECSDENGRPFYPRSLERGVRSERAITLAVAEMYIRAVSSRKVTTVVELLCGLDIPSTQVGGAAVELEEQLGAWRNRQLGEITYLILDARYEKVRHDGAIVPCALLTATGIGPDGERSILGCSVQLTEAATHWRRFLERLIARGMPGVKLVASDDHAGLKVARQAVLAGVAWQRCQFHLMQNAMPHVPKIGMRAEVAKNLRRVFDADEPAEAERRPRDIVTRYQKSAHNPPPGSRRTSPKPSPCSACPPPIGDGFARPTGLSGSTKRSNDGRG